MSNFAVEYLELMTACRDELRVAPNKYSPLTFFGRTTPYSFDEVSWIIQASTEEWESTVTIDLTHPDTNEKYTLRLDEVIHCGSSLNGAYDPNLFLADIFKYELDEDFLEKRVKYSDDVVIKDLLGLERLFSVATDQDLKYLAACYATAVEAKIIDKYSSLYSALKLKYPLEAYYPSFDFSYSETDYYESSTCY